MECAVSPAGKTAGANTVNTFRIDDDNFSRHISVHIGCAGFTFLHNNPGVVYSVRPPSPPARSCVDDRTCARRYPFMNVHCCTIFLGAFLVGNRLCPRLWPLFVISTTYSLEYMPIVNADPRGHYGKNTTFPTNPSVSPQCLPPLTQCLSPRSATAATRNE